MEFIKTNVLGTKLILENCISASVDEFILASSYAVYGNRKTPANTNSELNPVDEYSLSKIMSEYLVKKEILSCRINGKILRLPSIYGKGGKGLVNIIESKISSNEPISFDSAFERNYLHVSDFVEYVSQIIGESDKMIYNITGERMSTQKIYDLLIKNNIDSNLSNLKKNSFLCDGDNKYNRSVKQFLFGK